jgi:aspartyl-tRNA(Asn)/glutamyl-tRNA(Gln) amidotransferase subunit A
MRRVPDWSTMSTAARHRWQDTARRRARALDPTLNAFAEISAAPNPLWSDNPLDSLPYAAKDVFQTPSHDPGGGFLDGRNLGVSGTCDLLPRLSLAGADLIGFTNMTELAYEPSGFNASRGSVSNP